MPVALDIPATETAIVEMTNAFRSEHKLAGVRPNAALSAAAHAYAQMLARNSGKLSHTLNGTTPATRAKGAGYSYCQIAENLAVIYDSRGFTAPDYARRAVMGWEQSPGHRRNLLMPEVTEIGVAVAKAGTNAPGYFAVQLFGRPEALKYTFQIVNRSGGPVNYAFSGKEHAVLPRQVITLTTCAAGDLTFKLDARSGVGRYEARDGRVYTLKPRAGGGVTVEVGRNVVSP
jgi:Cysteine-rich secretory protein family